ncbi:MAG TPA: iron chelate uptake ABC transporter family permease subunit, partial [Deinococcales bacterium]|nr:iron chelate uptake ABC transporter family permease subunit [Deinococcales bacterium]
AVLLVLRYTRLPEDATLGVMLSVFFGTGIALLTFIQNGTNAGQAGLDKFLFGQAATIVASDVLLMAAIAGLALLLTCLFYKEFKLISFDPDYAASLGLPVRALGTLLTSLAVLAVMVGLQSVGVVLMAAMLVAPAAAARQWTNRLGRMLALAAVFGAASGVAGALASATGEGLPTGPLVVVAVSLVTLASLLFAPLRGIAWGVLRDRANARLIRQQRLLLDAHVLHNHGGLTVRALARQRRLSEAAALAELRQLEGRGLAVIDGEAWRLTPEGDAQAHALERELRRAPKPAAPAQVGGAA